MHVDLAAVVARDLDLEDTGAVPVVSLDLCDGSSLHRVERGALCLLHVGATDLLSGVAADGVRDAASAKSQNGSRRTDDQLLPVHQLPPLVRCLRDGVWRRNLRGG